jgi:hypothetical protein
VSLVDVADTSDTAKQIEKLGRKTVPISADLSKKDCVQV